MFGKFYLGDDCFEFLERGSFFIRIGIIGLWNDVHKQHAGSNVFKILRREYDGVWDEQTDNKFGVFDIQFDNKCDIALKHAQSNVL